MKIKTLSDTLFVILSPNIHGRVVRLVVESEMVVDGQQLTGHELLEVAVAGGSGVDFMKTVSTVIYGENLIWSNLSL
jgi:hypothetical protein